jgi:hypothetical protein
VQTLRRLSQVVALLYSNCLQSFATAVIRNCKGQRTWGPTKKQGLPDRRAAPSGELATWSTMSQHQSFNMTFLPYQGPRRPGLKTAMQRCSRGERSRRSPYRPRGRGLVGGFVALALLLLALLHMGEARVQKRQPPPGMSLAVAYYIHIF